MIIKSANSYKLWWKKQKQVSILAAEAHLVTKKTGRIFERCSAAWEVVTKHFLQIQKKTNANNSALGNQLLSSPLPKWHLPNVQLLLKNEK